MLTGTLEYPNGTLAPITTPAARATANMPSKSGVNTPNRKIQERNVLRYRVGNTNCVAIRLTAEVACLRKHLAMVPMRFRIPTIIFRKSFITTLAIGVLIVVLGVLAVATDLWDWRLVPNPTPSRC
jgi:hypothetical protein